MSDVPTRSSDMAQEGAGQCQAHNDSIPSAKVGGVLIGIVACQCVGKGVMDADGYVEQWTVAEVAESIRGGSVHRGRPGGGTRCYISCFQGD